ncbi:MAG TPA: hypothetical protein VGQ93_08400 [Lysobacter sp.]|nr:hypothetical protein [Lysobacter sp.]
MGLSFAGFLCFRCMRGDYFDVRKLMNPDWSQKDQEAMLQKHLDLTTGEVVVRSNKDWPADIHAYDEGSAHMLKFSDTLTEGIAKQFPSKARK